MRGMTSVGCKCTLTTMAVMLVLMSAHASSADGFAQGRVVGFIHGLDHTHVSIYMEAAIAGTPSCSGDTRRFALDVSSVQGRVAYGALLTAMHAKTAVHAHGNGSCNLTGQEETLLWFVADPPLQ